SAATASAPACRPLAAARSWPTAAPRAASVCPPEAALAASMSGAPENLLENPILIGRMTVRADFLACARGKKAVRPHVLVQAAPSEKAGAGLRAGFTATKKIGGAVQRNRAKRRLREAARRTLAGHGRPGCDYVFVARHSTAAAPWPALLDDVQS